MSPKHESLQPPQDPSTISGLVARAKEEGHAVTEIKVWQTDTITVPNGTVGMASTDELNGCHVSIFLTATEGGHDITMTHYPPEIGAGRYREALAGVSHELEARGAKPEMVVTLTATDRVPAETSEIGELFPGTPRYDLFYTASDPERRAGPDAGMCVAVLDTREGGSQLHVATDSGDLSIPVASGDNDMRPQDEVSMDDIEKAHAAALAENVIVDAYIEAKHEDEIFNKLAAEALKDTDDKEAVAKNLENLGEKAHDGLPSVSAQRQQAEMNQVSQQDERTQAAAALKAAGYQDRIPAGSQVYKELNGNLVVIGSEDVTVITPQSGGNRVETYQFDSKTNTLTVGVREPNAINEKISVYSPGSTEGAVGTITLPPVVARMAGFDKVAPV